MEAKRPFCPSFRGAKLIISPVSAHCVLHCVYLVCSILTLVAFFNQLTGSSCHQVTLPTALITSAMYLANFFKMMKSEGVPVSPNVKPGILVTHPLYDKFAQAGAFIQSPKVLHSLTQSTSGKMTHYVDC